MANYRRNFVPGGTFFFTVNLVDRRRTLLIEQVGPLRAAFRRTRTRHPFSIEPAAILPDHLHMIWTLPPGDADFALRWRLIKRILALPAAGRTHFREPRREGRTRDLAAAILGAHGA